MSKRQLILDALAERPLTREELKAKLAETGNERHFTHILKMGSDVLWRMVEVDGEPMAQYALADMGFAPETPSEPVG